jgi:cob(I)alamin adenosyltransferase
MNTMSTNDWEQGYTQIFTGNGKGKTSAALGIALRALGAGYKVFIAQFLKGRDSSERTALKTFGNQIKISCFGQISFVRGKPSAEDVRLAQEGFNAVKNAVNSGEYRVVILDEANAAIQLNLILINDLLDLINNKPKNVEIIITGRNADPRLIEIADLVTDMCEVKHYYNKGVLSRRGIEE